MITKQTTVVNETGIHARPASNFINQAKRYQSKITIRNVSREGTMAVNAKSIAMVLSIAAGKGMKVEIAAEGADELQAVEDLTDFISAGLGE